MQFCFLAVSLVLALELAAVQAQPVSSNLQQNETPTIKQLWTLDGRFTDAKHGVTFRYPSAWSTGVQFGYWSPALVETGQFRKITGFGYDAGGFPERPTSPYAHTTLEGFGIVYTAFSTATAQNCDARAATFADSTKSRHNIVGRRRFSSWQVGTGGMSQSISGTLYATFANATCYLFETDEADAAEETWEDTEAEAQAGDTAPAIFHSSVSSAQAATIAHGLRRIIETVRIRQR